MSDSTVISCPRCGGTIGRAVSGTKACTCGASAVPGGDGAAVAGASRAVRAAGAGTSRISTGHGSATTTTTTAGAAAVMGEGGHGRTSNGEPRSGGGTLAMTMDPPSTAGYGAAGAAGAARPGEKKKICCKCGADITHAKRLKDASTGRYWCYDCGTSDPAHTAHAHDVLCPECHKHVAPLAMTKQGDRYICLACYKRLGENGGKSGGGGSALKIVLALALLLIAIFFIVTYTNAL